MYSASVRIREPRHTPAALEVETHHQLFKLPHQNRLSSHTTFLSTPITKRLGSTSLTHHGWYSSYVPSFYIGPSDGLLWSHTCPSTEGLFRILFWSNPRTFSTHAVLFMWNMPHDETAISASKFNFMEHHPGVNALNPLSQGQSIMQKLYLLYTHWVRGVNYFGSPQCQRKNASSHSPSWCYPIRFQRNADKPKTKIISSHKPE